MESDFVNRNLSGDYHYQAGLLFCPAVDVLPICNLRKEIAPKTVAIRAATARLAEVVKRVDTLEFPLNVAAAIAARGLFVGEPKSPVSAATQQRYDQLVGELRQLYREWNLI